MAKRRKSEEFSILWPQKPRLESSLLKFVSHQSILDMTMCWVPWVWHTVTPPPPPLPLKNPGYAPDNTPNKLGGFLWLRYTHPIKYIVYIYCIYKFTEYFRYLKVITTSNVVGLEKKNIATCRAAFSFRVALQFPSPFSDSAEIWVECWLILPMMPVGFLTARRPNFQNGDLYGYERKCC